MGWVCRLVFFAVFMGFSTVTVAKEYCIKETLLESCDSDEVLLVVAALYGRMAKGRCVERDYGYIGCSTDVTDILAGHCSARKECLLANIEAIFSNLGGCPGDLKPFLNATFSCIKVDVVGATQCSTKGHIELTTSTGYLASVTTQEHGYGSERCPWIINALPGQRINISLLDFADYESINRRQKHGGSHSQSPPKYCREYAMIKEGNSMKNVVACSEEPRKQRVYTSLGHQVAVHIRDSVLESSPSVHFLLLYEVVGCALPPLAADMFLSHVTDDEITVRCNNTVDDWRLKCQGGVWVGAFGNCTNSGAGAAASESRALPYGVSILIIIGVALVICFGILFIGLMHINRRQRPRFKGQHRQLEHSEACVTEMKNMANSSTVPRTPRAKHASLDRGYSPMLRTQMRSTVGGEYAHIWELRRPIPVATPEVPKSRSSAQPGDSDTKGKHTKTHHRCKSCSSIIDCNSPGVTFSTFKPAPDHVYESPRFQTACKCKRESVDPSCSGNAILSKTRLFFEEEKFGVLPERDPTKKQFRHEGQVSV